MTNSTKLYRTRTPRVLGGVAGGLAKYFNVDVILTRLLFVIVFFAGGGGVLIYIVLWIITPEEPLITPHNGNSTDNSAPDTPNTTGTNMTDAEIVDEKKQNNNRTFIAGIVLILVGFLFLLNTLIPNMAITKFWPLILIIAGVMMLINETKGKTEIKTENEPSKTESHEI